MVFCGLQLEMLTPLSLGYGCTGHEGSACSSAVVHVQGPIRTIRPDPYDRVGTVDQRCSFVAHRQSILLEQVVLRRKLRLAGVNELQMAGSTTPAAQEDRAVCVEYPQPPGN